MVRLQDHIDHATVSDILLSQPFRDALHYSNQDRARRDDLKRMLKVHDHLAANQDAPQAITWKQLLMTATIVSYCNGSYGGMPRLLLCVKHLLLHYFGVAETDAEIGRLNSQYSVCKQHKSAVNKQKTASVVPYADFLRVIDKLAKICDTADRRKWKEVSKSVFILMTLIMCPSRAHALQYMRVCLDSEWDPKMHTMDELGKLQRQGAKKDADGIWNGKCERAALSTVLVDNEDHPTTLELGVVDAPSQTKNAFRVTIDLTRAVFPCVQKYVPSLLTGLRYLIDHTDPGGFVFRPKQPLDDQQEPWGPTTLTAEFKKVTESRHDEFRMTVEAQNARLYVEDHDLDRAKFVCDRLQHRVNTAFQSYLHNGAVQLGLIEDDGTLRVDEQSITETAAETAETAAETAARHARNAAVLQRHGRNSAALQRRIQRQQPVAAGDAPRLVRQRAVEDDARLDPEVDHDPRLDNEDFEELASEEEEPPPMDNLRRRPPRRSMMASDDEASQDSSSDSDDDGDPVAPLMKYMIHTHTDMMKYMIQASVKHRRKRRRHR